MITSSDGNLTSPPRVLLVTGLSGAGKSTILHILEDLGREVIDNPPLGMLDAIAARADRPLAIGVDSRTRGFDARSVLEALLRLKQGPGPSAELIYATADETSLLRRYTATRRRHPLAPLGSVKEGIEAEIALTATLRDRADLVIDTSDLSTPELRRLVETRFGDWLRGPGEGLTVTLMSFAYPAGLPREADMVFDARFLRNPHYEADLREKTGLDEPVAAYVSADPDYAAYFTGILSMLCLILPRFVKEGKKYATIAIGCSGGRHRSVTIAEALARQLVRPEGAGPGSDAWPVAVFHRELSRVGESGQERGGWRWARSPGGPDGDAPSGD
ncbi:RNase adapter RapZ [Acetobacter sp. AN02]|uniref:RNase adapter RapZ n=1 Tax=Acetobacter sp. AN02 TaxID=2894186 RepID=UPI002434256B|nr:RNase adapter RapZ [Acetobacter sp. AN02]MDG6094884.1 RNase adapter RapZ [Acetobacter sp. AN02]